MVMKKNFLELSKKTWIITALIMFLINAVMFAHFYKHPPEVVISQFQKDYPLLSPERGFYPQKDLIVNIQPIRDQLVEIGKDQDVSIYFEYLPTGANIAVNKDQKIWPASLMKIPIAMAIMGKLEDGEIQLDNNLILNEEDRNSDFGNLYKNPAGTSFTVEKLLEEMLVNSDNTARNILSKKLETTDLDDVLNHLGIEYDYRNNEQISAKKYSIFWRSLFYSSYLKPENSSKLIEIMSGSSAEQYLAGAIPNTVKFSHKIGALFDVNNYADSGIVYLPGRPYILTVMTKNKDQKTAEGIMQDVSQKVYAYISKY